MRKAAGPGIVRSRPSTAASASLPLLASPNLGEAKIELTQLAQELDAITLAKVAEPDYEALEHEREHQDAAAAAGAVKRETEQERAARQRILEDLKQRLQNVRQMLGLASVQA